MARSLNSKKPDIGDNSAGMIDGQKARALIDRIVSLEEDAKILKDDIKSVYDEVARGGFLAKVIRQKVKEIRMDAGALAKLRAEQDYMDRLNAALGEFIDTPLGGAAKEAAEKWQGEFERAGIA